MTLVTLLVKLLDGEVHQALRSFGNLSVTGDPSAPRSEAELAAAVLRTVVAGRGASLTPGELEELRGVVSALVACAVRPG